MAVVGTSSSGVPVQILKSNSVPAGVVATTTWKIVGAGHTYTGGRGKTTIVFNAGTYTLSTLATGFAGAGKIQP